METERIALRTCTASIEVEISDTQSHLVVEPTFLEDLVRRVLTRQGIEQASISIALVDDSTIRGGQPSTPGPRLPTDVISFGLSEVDDPTLVGELVISAEMATATARDVGVAPCSELALYVVHGLLHLCGLDDQDLDSAEIMHRREGEILEGEGLINTFPLVGLARADEEGRESVRCPR